MDSSISMSAHTLRVAISLSSVSWILACGSLLLKLFPNWWPALVPFVGRGLEVLLAVRKSSTSGAT